MGFLDDYETVEDRLAKFWREHPKGRVVTELQPAPDGQWIVAASIYRNPDELVAATGLAHEHVTEKGVNATSALENCETSAIGRALANLGYAAKGKRPSREEMAKTVKPPASPKDADEAARAVQWIAEEGKIFKAWTKPERSAAYFTALKRLGYEGLDTMEQARHIFDELKILYEQRPLGEPVEDVGLPLEEGK